MADPLNPLPDDTTALLRTRDLTTLASAADRAAAQETFARFRTTKAAATLRAHAADLARWAAYLAAVRSDQRLTPQTDRATLAALAIPWMTTPDTWAPVSWGLIEAFLHWQLHAGYSLASIARALATVRSYARLAAQAGVIAPDTLTLIETVTTPTPHSKAGRNSDAQRPTQRIGSKKAVPTELSRDQARILRNSHPDTPQGRRDRLLMCLLLEHGLRVSEVAGLTIANLDQRHGRLTLYRPKVHLWQTLELSQTTLAAVTAAAEAGELLTEPHLPLVRRSTKTGQLSNGGMGIRSIAARVAHLGSTLLALQHFSPHDCRHFWASHAQGDLFTLQEAGGWASLEMPRRYQRRKQVANRGLRAPADGDA